MKTGYLTDSFSTLGGLAAVAYGDPDYFREVQNQIYSNSPTRFIDMHRPSAVLEDVWGTWDRMISVIVFSLKQRYSSDQTFSDYVDIELGPSWEDEISFTISENLKLSFDSLSEYGLTLSDYLANALNLSLPSTTPELSRTLDVKSLVDDAVISLVSDPVVGDNLLPLVKGINNNPQTKISKPPLYARVDLDNSVDLGSDYRGVEFTRGYLSPEEYWSSVPYPGFESSNFNAFPPSIADTISQGYLGYPSRTPLERVYNPAGAESISSVDVSPVNSSGSGAFSPNSVWSEIPDPLQIDRDVYSISLIGEVMNGYTSFDPRTMSNGDFIDVSLVPQFEEDNSDTQGGLNASARTFNQAF